MAICCVSEKIQTAYVSANTPRGLDFFDSLHLTILGRPANFEFFSQLRLHARWMTSLQKVVIPLKKGIHIFINYLKKMDSCLRRNDTQDHFVTFCSGIMNGAFSGLNADAGFGGH